MSRAAEAIERPTGTGTTAGDAAETPRADRPVRLRLERRPPAVDIPHLARELGVDAELAEVRALLDRWLDGCDRAIHGMVRYQLGQHLNLVGPLVVLACTRASGGPTEPRIPVAAAVELFHHYALILDDIVDRDRVRAGRTTLHCRFGALPALMTSAYFAFAAGDFIAHDDHSTTVFTTLGESVAAAECRAWRERHEPVGVAVWQRAVHEHTAGTFRACAAVATRDESLVRSAELLGALYHGAADVVDVRAALARDGDDPRAASRRVLTLPGALAMEDPEAVALYRSGEPALDAELLERMGSALPAAEERLDELARDARDEARRAAPDPQPLVALVEHFRASALPGRG